MKKKSFFFGILFCFGMLTGCMHSVGAFRKKPIFPLSWKSKVWEISGSFQNFFSYDCDLDGFEELILVGEKKIVFFRGIEEGWQEKPFWVFSAKEAIKALDLSHCPGKNNVWLVLLLESQILFFPNMEKEEPILVDTIQQDNWKSKNLFGYSFFQYIDKNMLLDLVIPFRKNFSWYAAIYFYKENQFFSKGVLHLKAPGLFSFPALGFSEKEGKKEILFQDKEILKIYTQKEDGCFLSEPQKTLNLEKYGLGKYPYIAYLVEIADINKKGTDDFIFQESPGENLWICLDQKKFYSIPLNALTNLMMNTIDYNQDGFLDIISVCMAKPNFFSLLWNYFFSGSLELSLDILYLCNQEGKFFLDKKEKMSLFLAYPLESFSGKIFLGDINGDSFYDCMEIQEKQICFLYDIAGFLSKEKFFLSPLLPAIIPFISMCIPKNQKDAFLHLPSFLACYTFFNAKIISLKGKQSRILLHYIHKKEKEKNILLLYCKK